MVRLISRQRGGLAALKLTKLFGIDDFPAAKDSGKVLIIIIYCNLIIIAAAASEPEANERGSYLISRRLHYRGLQSLARNSGHAQVEDLGCAAYQSHI